MGLSLTLLACDPGLPATERDEPSTAPATEEERAPERELEASLPAAIEQGFIGDASRPETERRTAREDVILLAAPAFNQGSVNQGNLNQGSVNQGNLNQGKIEPDGETSGMVEPETVVGVVEAGDQPDQTTRVPSAFELAQTRLSTPTPSAISNASAFPGFPNVLSIPEGGVLLTIQAEENNTGYAGANLVDGNSSSYWRSTRRDNDLIYEIDSTGGQACFDGFYAQTVNSSYSVSDFMLLLSSDATMFDDTGALGWSPVIADAAPMGLMNFAHWGQGGRVSSFSGQENGGGYAASNVNDGNTAGAWRWYNSYTAEFDFRFDRDWDGAASNAVGISQLELVNSSGSYGIELFQVELRPAGGSFSLLEVPGSSTGDANFNFASSYEGGVLSAFSHQENATGYAADNALDHNEHSYWRTWNSTIANIDLAFDTDLDGTSALGGDSDDLFTLENVELQSKGGSYAPSLVQVEVQTGAGGSPWSLLEVPGTALGDADFIFSSRFEGAAITAITHQENTGGYAGQNALDRNQFSYWRMYNGQQSLDLSFDVDLDGTMASEGDTDDLIEVTGFALLNSGGSYSTQLYQVLTRQNGSLDFVPAPVPGTAVGDPNFNFANRFEAGSVISVTQQENTGGYAAQNVIDGNTQTYWRSYNGNQELVLGFDADQDGSLSTDGDTDDRFALTGLLVSNAGGSYSVEKYQVELQTAGQGFSKLPVPGTAAGDADFNFASQHEGAVVTRVDTEENSGGYAAANLLDGTSHTYWRSYTSRVNEIDVSWDTDFDGTSADDGDTDDAFELKRFRLTNAGSSYSVQNYQLLVKQQGSNLYTPVPVPGSATPPSLINTFNGGLITRIATEEVNYPALNLIDGAISYWRSYPSQVNEIDFTFDTDGDGTSAEGGDVDDQQDLGSFVLSQMGNSYSTQTFMVEVKTAAVPTWKAVAVPGSAIGDAGFNFVHLYEGAEVTLIDVEENSTSLAGRNALDGVPFSRWRSFPTRINTMEMTWDSDDDGTTAEDGDADDVATFLDDVEIRVPLNTYALRAFVLDAKTTTSGGTWLPLNVPGSVAAQANFNFLSAWEGAARISGDIGQSEDNLNDGNRSTRTDFTTTTNTIEWDFDANLDGASGDLINFVTVRLFNSGDTNALQDFEIDVQVAGIWQAVPPPGGGTIFTANQVSGAQDFNIPAQVDVTAFRLRTLTNYGGSRTRIYEVEVFGTSVGPRRTFETNNTTDYDHTFTWTGAERPANVTALRIRMLDNEGGYRTELYNLEVRGPAPGPSHVFSAAQQGDVTVTPAATITAATAVRLRTLANYGGYRIGAREFKALSATALASTVFVAPQNGVHDVTLDTPFVDVVSARLRVISNYGGYRVSVRDLELLGDALGPSHVFTAAQSGSTTVTLPAPIVDVESVLLRTIDNYGGYRTTLHEFQLLGPALGPATVFTAAQSGRTTVTLDASVANVEEARIHILNNYGGYRTTLHEFELLGPALGPSHTFPVSNAVTNTLNVDDVNNVSALRLRVLNNQGGYRMSLNQLRVLGPALGPTHTFTAVASSNNNYTLPATIPNIEEARFRTLDNLSGYRQQIRELRLLGPAIGASYVFTAPQVSDVTHFPIGDAAARLFRFHSFDNYGGYRTRLEEISLVDSDGGCPVLGPEVLISLSPDSPSGTIGRGIADQVLMAFTVEATEETIINTSFRFHTYGTGHDADDIIEYSLYADNDGDGVVSPGDSAAGTGVLALDNGSVTLSGLSLTLNVPRTFLLTVSINNNPFDGETFGAMMGHLDVFGQGQSSGDAPRGVGNAIGDLQLIVDLLAPVVTPPPTKGFEATDVDGRSVRVSELGQATAVDDGTSTITIERRFGAANGPVITSTFYDFPLGTTLVFWVAIDGAGNEGFATQQVRIVDTTPPVIDDPADVQAEATSPFGTSVTLPPYSVTDIADANPVVGTDAPTLYPLGLTTVTVTATDASGNSTSKTQAVTIVDTTPPDFVDADGLGVLPPLLSGYTPGSIVLPEPTVTDNGYPSAQLTVVVLTPPPASPGTLIVTWQATDPDNNTVQATQEVFFQPGDASLVLNTVLYNKGTAVDFGEYHSAQELELEWTPEGTASYTYAFNIIPEEVDDRVTEVVGTYDDERKYSPVLGHFTDSASLPLFNFKLLHFGIDNTPPTIDFLALQVAGIDFYDDTTYEKMFYGEEVDMAAIAASDPNAAAFSGIGSVQIVIDAGGPGQNALSFDGDDVVTVPHARILEPVDEFTVEAWIRSDNDAGDLERVLVMKGDALSGSPRLAGYVFMLDEGKLEAILSDGVVSDSLTGARTLTDGQWHHVALVREARTIVDDVALDWILNLYIDGQLDATKAVEPLDLVSADQIRVGNRPSGQGFVGHLDEVAVHQVALSQLELSARFADGVGTIVDPNGLTALLLEFNGTSNNTSGQTVTDRSGWGYDGVLGEDTGSASDDPTRVQPLGTWSSPVLVADNAFAAVGGGNVAEGPANVLGVTCDQSAAACIDGNTTLKAAEIGAAVGTGDAHRIDAIVIDRAGNAARTSTIIRVQDLEGMVDEALVFIADAKTDFSYLTILGQLQTAEVHLQVAARYLTLNTGAAAYRFTGGATLRVLKAVQVLQGSDLILFGSARDDLRRTTMYLARAVLGDSRVRLDDERAVVVAPDDQYIVNGDATVVLALAARAAGNPTSTCAEGRQARDDLAILLPEYATYRSEWLAAEAAPTDFNQLVDMIQAMAPVLVDTIDAQIGAVQADPATPVQDQLQIVRDRIDDIRGCTVQLAAPFDLLDDEFLFCYMNFVEVGEVLQAVQGNLVDTYDWKTGTAMVLFGLLRISLELSPTSVSNIIAGAGLAPQTDFNDALAVYLAARAKLDSGDVDGALTDFISEKCRVVEMYNTYYSTNSVSLIPVPANNVSSPLDQVVSPSMFGCP